MEETHWRLSWPRLAVLLVGVAAWGFLTPLVRRWTGWSPLLLLPVGAALILAVTQPVRRD